MSAHGFDASRGAPPEVVGAVVAWLAANPDAAEDAMADAAFPPRSKSTKDGRNIEAHLWSRDPGAHRAVLAPFLERIGPG